MAFTTANVFVMPDYITPFELIVDACGFGFGAALLQEGRPISCVGGLVLLNVIIVLVSRNCWPWQ